MKFDNLQLKKLSSNLEFIVLQSMCMGKPVRYCTSDFDFSSSTYFKHGQASDFEMWFTHLL
jgi:hypothetical protein